MLKQVFLSHRHESPEHTRAVRRLGELIRQAKIPVALDYFYLDDNPGGPGEGWPKWCEDNANESACVLIIPSEGWFAAYNKDSGAGGFGAAAEADLFRQAFWDEKGHNERIRLAFLNKIDADKVPVRLRTWHQFQPFENADDLDQLIRWVADCLGLRGIEPPIVRWPRSIEFQPDLADRTKKEWPAVVDLLTGQSRERILLFEGESGLGKSKLVQQAAAYATKLGLTMVHVEFSADLRDVAEILGRFDLELGPHLPNFSGAGASKTHLLRKDLRSLRQPVLVIFDGYNKDVADNKAVADWLKLQFLTEVETALGVAVIVAGQTTPDFANAGWRDLAQHLQLQPIKETELWEPWVKRRYPNFYSKRLDLRTVIECTKGLPSVIVSSLDGLGNA